MLGEPTDIPTDMGSDSLGRYLVLKIRATFSFVKIVLSKSHEKFSGAVLDTGAEKKLIFSKQGRAYCKTFNIPFELNRSDSAFAFGKHVAKSIDKIRIIVQTRTKDIRLCIDVIPNDIPLLVGLDILNECQWNVLPVQNQLQFVSER